MIWYWYDFPIVVLLEVPHLPHQRYVDHVGWGNSSKWDKSLKRQKLYIEVRNVNINLEHWRVCCLCFQQLLQSCHGWYLSPTQYKLSFVSDLWQRPKLKRWRWCKRFPAATKKWCFFFIFLFHFGHFPYLSQHLPPGLCLSGSLRFCLCSSPGSTF